MPALITVITATLNRRELLRRAIDSVVAQGLEDVEHIVIDGASSDGTLDMLTRYPHVQVFSELDRSVYEAWNKGLLRARGALICILNSDDEIPAGAFAAARTALADNPELDLLSGPVELVTQHDGGPSEVRIIDDPRILSLRLQDVGPGVPITNGRYLTRRLVTSVGAFDERYRLVSDRDYLLRILLRRPRHVISPVPLYRYYRHEQSLTLANDGADWALALDSLSAARKGLACATSTGDRAAYARWHAWASFYVAGLAMREGRFAGSIRHTLTSFACDPFWPIRLPGTLVRHVRERQARRGRIIAA